MNTQDSPAEIDPSQAQDLLNVNIQPGGAALFKRDGYGLFLNLPISCSTCAVHGGAHFQQVGGNDVQLWGNDTELSGSVNDAAFVRLATGTVSATWQCADSQGFAYCLTSSRDTAVKTDGSVANTTYQTSIPLGTMLTFTPLQLVAAGVSGSESTLYISQQNAFTNFTIGVLPSSSFTEPIASPGSRITHVAFYFGKLFWWKDQSFGYATFTNQFDWQLTIVSNQIGTLDNSDAFWNSSGFDAGTQFSGTAHANAEKSPGGIFFRGQDNHLYVYDGYYLTRLSRSITPTVTAANRRKANLWTQTTQADFQSGANLPTNNTSETISLGDVIVSSFSINDDTTAEFQAGTFSNTFATNNAVYLSTASGNLPNNSFETPGAGATTNNWTTVMDGSFNWSYATSVSPSCGVINPQDGSIFGRTNILGNTTLSVRLLDTNNSVLSTVTPPTPSCSWTQNTLTSTSNYGKRTKLNFHFISGSFVGDVTSDTFTFTGSLSFYTNGGTSGGFQNWAIDDVVGGSNTVTSGTFTSKIFNTGFTSSTVKIVSISSTTNTEAISYVLQHSTNGADSWNTLTSAIDGNAVGNQFLRYVLTFTASTDTVLSTWNGFSILSRSTGTYYSAVRNAPSLTSWGLLQVTDTMVGNSTATYYTRSSTNSFSVLSTTPTWVIQTKNASVSASTGTFFQLRSDFGITAATEAPTLNDFTFNWFEGSAADKAYISYFNDAIWFSVSASTSASTNNRIFYWDILNGAWLVYDIAANGFQIENNALYFGDPIQGRVFKFGGVTTDNAVTINSYWRSKSFLGADPFVQNEFVQADFVLGESSTTLTYTYTLDSKTSTAYVITAYDAAASLIQRNFLLPAGKIGKYYDFKIGDNSSNASWKLMAHRAHYNKLNWQPVLK